MRFAIWRGWDPFSGGSPAAAHCWGAERSDGQAHEAGAFGRAPQVSQGREGGEQAP